MSKFALTYTLVGRGWARLTIRDREASVEIAASYLYDSLADLAQLAWTLRSGGTAGQACFFDEPGETQLIVETSGDGLAYEVREFADYTSWRKGSEKFTVLISGTTTVERFVHQITQSLWKIYSDLGVDGYLKLWDRNEFPVAIYKKLIGN